MKLKEILYKSWNHLNNKQTHNVISFPSFNLTSDSLIVFVILIVLCIQFLNCRKNKENSE